MSRVPRRIAISIAISVLSLNSQGALSQSFSDFFVFGGSYSDAGTYLVEDPDGTIVVDGNTFEERRWTINPAPVWNQLLGQAYGLDIEPNLLIDTASDVSDPTTIENGGTNYAQGGAAVLGSGNFEYNTRSVTAQILAYLDSVSYAPDPSALYVIEAGGNTIIRELLDIEKGTTTFADALARIEASAVLTGGLGVALSDLGARYVMVINTNDLGDVPTISGYSKLDTLVGDIVKGYNDTLLDTLILSGKEFIYVDMYGLFKELSDNGAAYGFLNTTDAACLSSITYAIDCTVGTLNPGVDPDGYLWDGGLHPSAAGHIAMSQYVQSILSAPGQYANLAEVPLYMNRSVSRFVDARLNPGASANSGLGVVFDGSGQLIDLASTGPGQGADGASGNVLGGLEYRLGDWVAFGVLGGYGAANTHYPDDSGGFDVDLYSVTAYAGSELGSLSLKASASYGWIDYNDIVRAFDLYRGRVLNHAETSGRAVSASASAGYQLTLNQNRFVPFASVAYQKIDVDGYAETGPDWSAMTFQNQQRTSLVGSIGLRFETTAAIVNNADLWLEAEYSHDFDAKPRNVTSGLTAARGVVFTLPYDIGPQEWFSLSGGLKSKIAGAAKLSVHGGLRISSNDIDNAWGGISLSIPLGGRGWAEGRLGRP